MSSSFNNKLAHAQSTPAGVDGSGKSTSRTPPTTPKKSGKMLCVRVLMLDDSITIFQVQAKAVGRLLFDQVCKQLNLLEADYFGLEYQDATTKYWLDFEKPLHRQIGLSLVDPLLTFCIKFYTPDPAQLEEEYTRYLFCLQIKRDLMQGDLQCNDNTAALIISYMVQAECGDYSPEDYPDHTYLSSHRFIPHQDKELERKVMENHKKHIGQSPAEADLNLLETARRCELYGMKMHPAKDHEGVPLNLAVAHMGIIVFQNSTKINTFSWAKIRKISFKRKRFLIKLHPEGYGFYKDIVEFIFDNRNQCKGFWKKCVENHGFFRCSYVKYVPRQKSRVLSRGSSSFRYSGKTQKQMVEYVRENYVKRQTFQRSQSFRHQSSINSSVVNVGGSISAHPLLPLGENAIAGSGASLSCGSMTLSGSPSPITHLVVAQPTVPTVMSQRLEHQHQQQQQIVSAADVHESATTSSDVTSIASLSPPHDTGQKRHYPTDMRCRFPETLTNPSRTKTLTTDRLRSNLEVATTVVVVEHSGSFEYKNGKYDYDCDYDVDKMYTEFRFPTMQMHAASFVHCDAQNFSGYNDPDILKDLGNSGRENGGWQRSASCKELGGDHQRERLLKTGTLSAMTKKMAATVAAADSSLVKFDSIRYCYSCHGATPAFGGASSRNQQHSVTSKVYPNSYPGTTCQLRVENNEDLTVMNGGNNMFIVNESDKSEDQKISQDDLSHDSYEILDKEMVFRSRSSSVNSDEMFVMENDYESVSKHILWREGSVDVEKRLGYVEPRYRNMDFNEFNEICKRGFASRNHDSSQSYGNIKFHEFSDKGGGGGLVKHDGVSRTKSDPYVSREDKLLNRQKLMGLHQKSFDLPSSEYNEMDDKCFSKSTADIPYTLRIRNTMNGTAREASVMYSEDCGIYENVELSRHASENVEEVGKGDRASHASQDSGLSLSLGTESIDDNDMDMKNVMLTKNSYEQVVTTKKSTKLMLSLSEENNETVVDQVCARVEENADTDSLPKKRSDYLNRSTSDEHSEKHMIKVKSVEVPKRSHSGRIRKSKSVEACDRKNSLLRTESAGSRGKKEIIVIDSDDYHSFDDSRSDKRSDGSDSVIIVEYRGSKKKKLSKKASSDSRGSQAESEASSFDAPRIKKKEFKKRNQGYYKDRIPTIEISEDETYKADSSSAAGLLVNEYEYSSDERHASGSDLSKTETVNEILGCGEPYVLPNAKSTNPCAGQGPDVNQYRAERSFSGSAQEEIQRCESLKIERTPLLTRLGLSEGSAISQMVQKTLPTMSRRAVSLDTPIVSLHRLPAITSFSSKDDTLDNAEGEDVLEEKAVSPGKSKIIPASVPEKTSSKADITSSFGTVESETNCCIISRPKSYSVIGIGICKPSLDVPFPANKAENGSEEFTPSKERSRSEGYDKNSEQPCDESAERKHSTRQERLDSFKKLRKFSIELWESEDVDSNRKKCDRVNSNEYDDNVFEEIKSVCVGEPKPPVDGDTAKSITNTEVGAEKSTVAQKEKSFVSSTYIGHDGNTEEASVPSSDSFMCQMDDQMFVSSPAASEPSAPPHLESSASSSVDENALPFDCLDEDELPLLPTASVNVEATLSFQALPAALSSPFNVGFFSLSRTLSRISERSTTSEQERTDFEDDLTKPLSRSSIDDSILSSDQHLSFSSDPPSGINLENVFDEDDDAIDDKLNFNIPPPLLTPEEEWPSPPCSTASVNTPVIDGDQFIASPSSDGSKKMDEEGSVSEDNKTLRDDDIETSDNESKKYKKEKPRGSVGDDTSAGITTSDWSSSTGTTVKQIHTTSQSCASKSEDNSLRGECVLSLSTETNSIESRKNSVSEFVPIPTESKYLTFDRKQISAERSVFFPSSFHSLDDEYDSPYTESEDTPSSPVPPLVVRRQPPPPARHFQDPGGNVQKLRSKVERNRMSRFMPNYTSSSMSTSLESPTNAERKLAKTMAKAKCYSYYSLARSPPSDGSSSSPDAPETPLTPNTIPRVSKRRRNVHTPRRRQQQRSSEPHKADYSMTPILAQVPHTYKPFHHHMSRRSRR